MSPAPRGSMRRSYLFAPGNHAKLLAKVFGAGADAVVLDLEDAVPPAEKDRAREVVRETLEHRGETLAPATYVRINHVSTPWWRDDVFAAVVPGIAGLRIPKVESALEARKVARAVAEAERANGVAPGSVLLTGTIESAAGVLAAAEIAKADRVEALCFGATDLARDMGAEPGRDEIETLYARSHLVLVSRAAGIRPPIASVQIDLKDEERLLETTRAARRLGFFGRSCIHPKQLPVIHRVFTPSAESVARAREIVRAYERAKAAGSGAFTMPDGGFVDEAIARQAEDLVALADALAPKQDGEETP